MLSNFRLGLIISNLNIHVLFPFIDNVFICMFSGALEKYVKILEEKFKNDSLKKIYAGVNGRDVEDPDMQAFFKFKCWL